MDAVSPSEMNPESNRGSQPLLRSPLLAPEVQYCCPGESHSISRAVHLSRLAAFYPACRQCPHRHDTGQLPPKTVERIQRVERRSSLRSIFEKDGVRGVYLNEFTPELAAKIAAAFASGLWEHVPLAGRTQSAGRPARRGPAIVAGYDERSSSPSVLTAVIDALHRMGCPVIDVGLVSRPCFAFAVDHLQAAGGILITGSGCEPSWSGMDLFLEGGIPLSLGTGLEAIERRWKEGVTRPTRRAGYQRTFQAVVPYEAGLWKHFHALRTLKVVCAARLRPVRRTLRQVFSKLPCTLMELEVPPAGQLSLRREVLLERLQARVTRRAAHLGVLIDDDGAHCQFVDERGQIISTLSLGAFLAAGMLVEHPQSPVVISDELLPLAESSIRGTLMPGGLTAGSLNAALRESGAQLGIEATGRYWFKENFPTADAIITLARVLQGLSRSDAAFSTLLK